ncbi:hypothetical protein LSTR_LSTR011865 [Laodelphax striatellus]|uniref:Pro-resilin n=1 Tax=Laodelphax striatellus TaxID=195883 RepID=A0A482XID1_LAOST|nr:hypothetical protein LSTR_LSTR011865 [Laodelphax striatellus]
MYIIQSTVLAACLLALSRAEPPVNNQYLPPSSNGYNYPSPNVPFPSPPPATPAYRPPPAPPAPRPTYGVPSPPAPRPQPTPTYSVPSPPAPRPTYGVPSGPPATGPNYQSQPNNQYGETSHLNMPHVPGMPYDFNYAVKDDYYGTDYSHNAVSDGDQVKGEYRVQLPDGRLQIVSYVADWATGFHADVRYEGQASYPEANKGGYPAAGAPAAAYGPPASQGY